MHRSDNSWRGSRTTGIGLLAAFKAPLRPYVYLTSVMNGVTYSALPHDDHRVPSCVVTHSRIVAVAFNVEDILRFSQTLTIFNMEDHVGRLTVSDTILQS